MSTCPYPKVVPAGKESMCHNHKSYGSFTQGIFPVGGLDLDKKNDFTAWLKANRDIIDHIDCFLLKHPLLDIPAYMYSTQIIHHTQIGYIFRDKEGKAIRHYVTQLQNSSNPPANATLPFELAATCRVKGKTPDQDKTIVTFNDKTGIFNDFLETENYNADSLIMQNKYTYFRGINMSYLKNTVNFNFFVESYKLWRLVNTSAGDTEKLTGSAADIEKIYPKTKVADQKYCGGPSDGTLFVFDTFSPSFLSSDEGTVMHFATMRGDGITNKMRDFVDWTFANFHCTKDLYQPGRPYVALSPAGLNYTWAEGVLGSEDCKELFDTMYGISANGKNWLVNKSPWDPSDPQCKLFDNLMVAVSKSVNILQEKAASPGEIADPNSPATPILCRAGNFLCDSWAKMVVTMMTNTDLFQEPDCVLEKHFDFTFGGKNDSDLSISENLFRSFNGYWPVAVFSQGYENGVSQTEFNTDPRFDADREAYASQALIFTDLIKGNSIGAANVTDNIYLKLLAEFFGAPDISTVLTQVEPSVSPMINTLKELMFLLFAKEFLGAGDLYLAGYRVRDINEQYRFSYTRQYESEPCIWKFPISLSTRAGQANDKLFLALMKWIAGGPELFAMLPDYIQNPGDAMNKLKQEASELKQHFAGILHPDVEKSDCDSYPWHINSMIPGSEKVNGILGNLCGAYNVSKVAQYEANQTIGAVTDKLITLVESVATVVGQDVKKMLPNAGKGLSGIEGDLKTDAMAAFSQLNKILNALISGAARFASYTHANYVNDEYIMFQLKSTKNKFYNLPDLNRADPTSCNLLGCLTNKVKYDHKVNVVKFRAPFPLTHYNPPRKKDNQQTTLNVFIVCVSIVIAVFVVGLTTLPKRLKR